MLRRQAFSMGDGGERGGGGGGGRRLVWGSVDGTLASREGSVVQRGRVSVPNTLSHHYLHSLLDLTRSYVNLYCNCHT